MTDLMKTHKVTIKRLSTTRGTSGGQSRSFTTAARSSAGLPTKWDCRAMLMSNKDRVDYGVRAETQAWKFLGEDDPQITVQDQLEFDFVDGQSEVVKVLVGSHARSHNEKFYRVFGEDDSTED